MAIEEMDRVFNMGVGMIAVVPPDEADGLRAVARAHDVPSWIIGGIVAGQGVDSLAARCAAAGGDAATCASAAVAAYAVVGQVSLLAGPGSELPGEGSTLGRRLGGKPRFAVWLRGGGLQLAVPDPTDPNGSAEDSGEITQTLNRINRISSS